MDQRPEYSVRCRNFLGRSNCRRRRCLGSEMVSVYWNFGSSLFVQLIPFSGATIGLCRGILRRSLVSLLALSFAILFVGKVRSDINPVPDDFVGFLEGYLGP